jgi:two-component system, LytTR family, sensor kinase
VKPAGKSVNDATPLAGWAQIAFAPGRGDSGVLSSSAAAFSRTAGALGAGWNRLPLFWRAQTAGWALFAVIDLVSLRLLYHDLPVAAARTATVVACLVVVSSLLRRLYAARRVNVMPISRAALWVVLLSSAGGATAAALDFAIGGLFGWPIASFLVPLTNYSIVLAGWSLCYFWIHAEVAEQAEHKRALRAEAEALRAELEELRLQLDPHFLFNALNGVAEEIPEHPEAALAMLRDLTAYLRYSLAGIRQTVVAVSAEVEALAAYLRVQQARFGARLVTTMTVAPEATDWPIVSFLLQPLVENAVKHGRRDEVLAVTIVIRRDGDALEVEIANTGGLASAKPPRNRLPIGLDNVRRRLALHYPDRHRFALAERGDQVVASLVLRGEPCSGS